MARRKGRNRKTGLRYRSGERIETKGLALREDVREVGYEARMRVFRMEKTDACRPEAGDHFGRLCLNGEISQRQYEAGNLYAQLVLDYRKTLPVKPVTSSSNLNKTPGFDGSDGSDPAYVERVERVRKAYFEARRVLLTSPDPLTHAVVDGVVIDGSVIDRFHGALREGLNRLAHEFRLPLSTGRAA